MSTLNYDPLRAKVWMTIIGCGGAFFLVFCVTVFVVLRALWEMWYV